MPFQLTITAAAVKRAFGALVLAAVLAAAGYGVITLIGSDDPFAGRVDPSRYQAVILSNPECTSVTSDRPDLSSTSCGDAFFIREGDASAREVVPLSQELHGPENRTLIRREQVILIQNLRPDSPVAEAIQRISRSS